MIHKFHKTVLSSVWDDDEISETNRDGESFPVRDRSIDNARILY